ncbi:MAG TPA: type II secretion system protein GspD [Gallionella sp.]|nr:type II secretion system protein GspD [Gallionella sp.]
MKPRDHHQIKFQPGVALTVLSIAMAGCATSSKIAPDKEDIGAAALAHRYTTSIANGADKAADDKARLYPGTGVVVKAPKPMVIQQQGGELTLSFEGADLREVVKTILSDILKQSYIMDPRVGGTITLHTKRPIAKSALLPTLETVLRMSDAVLIHQEDGVYQVVPASLAGKGNLTPQLGEVGKPLPSGYSIQVVPLKFIGVADMTKLLEPLGIGPGAVRMDPLRNLLILSGTEPELRHMLETIDMFDVDWIAGMSVGLFTLKNVEAKTVVDDLAKLFGDKNMGPLAGALRIVPIERLNALLVVTPQAKYLDEAKTWVERLDRSGGVTGGQQLYVYQVQNGKAEELAKLLNEAFGKAAAQKNLPAPTLAPGLAAAEVKNAQPVKPVQEAQPRPATGDGVSLPKDVRIIADKNNNALLIVASAGDYDMIESALRKLDVAPRQVLIEVTIAEVTLTGELKYGLDWAITNGPNISGKMNNFGIASALPFSYSWTSAAGNIKAVLNALAKDSKLKVVSSPHITVADNQKASIQVGDQVPTISQTESTSTTTTGVIQSVQYLNTGVLLTVTPHVNAGGLVTMDINQEVSNAASTTTSTINSPTISKRTAQSTVTVQSGETLIMAGLISDQDTHATSGLPLLSRLPLLGGLFGSLDDNHNRTELVILITPRVMKTSVQASEITDEYRSRMVNLEDMLKTLNKNRATSMADPETGLPVKLDAPPSDTGPAPVKDRKAKSAAKEKNAAQVR